MPVEQAVDKKRASGSNAQNALLILCVICMVGLSLTIVGLVIVVPLCVGLYFSIRERNSTAHKASTRAVQTILLICGIGVGGVALYYSYLSLSAAHRIVEFKENFRDKEDLSISHQYNNFDIIRKYGDEAYQRISANRMKYDNVLGDFSYDVDRNKNTAIEIGLFSAAIFVGIVLLEFGWRRPLAARIDHGELAFPARTGKQGIDRLITGKEGFTRYSVAEELLKWNALRESGTVSEDEYQAARKRLLGN